MTRSLGREGISTGDVVLALATLCLVLALAYPWTRRERVLARVDAVAVDVDSLGAAARRYHERTGTWPHATPAGVLPEELAAPAPVGLTMAAPRYRLEWDVWERIAEPVADQAAADSVLAGPPPQQDTLARSTPRVDTLAGITVHVDDARIRGLLLERYGEERSFVRDSSWTLVLHGRGDGG